MATRPYYDDESEPEAATPEPAPEVETALREGLLQGTEPPPESYPVKPETATDLERYQAMHSKQPFATQEFVPGLDQAQGNLRSALDMAAKIQPPPYRPIPTRPPPEPGFKGALKDALRGMIPGYVQGQEAALQERQLEAAAQNKYDMEMYKQQLGLVKPMLQKDYETQAWMQKVTMTEAYLRKTFPWMTEAEIAARSTGHNYTTPRQPGAGIPREFHFPPGIVPGDRLVAVMNQEGQWMAPGGAAIPPQILNKAIGVGKEAEGQNLHWLHGIQEEGAPAGSPARYGYIDPNDPEKKVQFIEGVKRAPIPPDPLLQESRMLRNALTQKTISESTELSPALRDDVNRLSQEFSNQPITKRFNVVMEGLHYARTADMKNPVNHQGLVYALAKIWDPESVVREGEYATVLKYSRTWLEAFKFDAMRIISNQGYFDAKTIANLRKAMRDRAKPNQMMYENLRSNYADRMKTMTGREDADKYLNDFAAAFETDDTAGAAQGRGTRTGVAIPPANPKEGDKFVDANSVTWIFQGGEWVEQ